MLSVVIAAMLSGAAPPDVYTLTTKLGVWDVTVEDLTGDGRQDILAITCDEHSYPLEKRLELFTATPLGTFRSKPSAHLALDPSVSVVFLAETDGSGPKEIFLGDNEGVTIFGLVQGEFQKLGHQSFPTLFPSGAREPLFFTKTVHDLDGDGIDEWLVPVAGGFEIRHRDTLLATVPAPVVSETRVLNNVVITHRLPAIQAFRVPDSDVQGLAFLSDEFADFSYGENWSQRRIFRVPVKLKEDWEAYALMRDINGDGFPDLIVTQTEGTINMKVLTQIYVASAPFEYPEKPTATFEKRGALTMPSLIDINGDDTLDLVLVGVPLSLRSIVNFFFRDKVTVKVDAYVYNDGDYPVDPTHRMTRTLAAPEGRERVAYTMGDFTGDGLIDAAFGTGGDRLEIFAGSEKDLISSDAWVALDIPTFGIARSYPLSGNSSDDIVIFHPGLENQTRIEVIVF